MISPRILGLKHFAVDHVTPKWGQGFDIGQIPIAALVCASIFLLSIVR